MALAYSAWVVSITLWGVLVVGLVCLLLCREILRSTTDGPEPWEVVGRALADSTSKASSGASSCVVVMRSNESARTRWPFRQAGPSLGSRIVSERLPLVFTER